MAKLESVSNNGMSAYYGTTMLLFVGLSVNCLLFWVSYKDIQCIAEDSGPVPEPEEEEEEDEEAADADAGRRNLRIWETLNIMSLNEPRVL